MKQHDMKNKGSLNLAKSIVLGGSLMVAFTGAANAGAILSAVGGTINSSGPGFGSLQDTFDQSGLLSGYTSGVTDFDTYIGTNPLHTSTFAGNEWFSNSGSNTASVTYDLGAVYSIDALALWNEEAAGIGLLDLYGSSDGVNFSLLSGGVTPTDHPTHPYDYSADVFGFGAALLQYVRLDMSRCPQQPGDFDSCAIGEVAFRQATQVPEPGTLALLALGLGGLVTVGRRKHKEQ
jgi:hypothetical protein